MKNHLNIFVSVIFVLLLIPTSQYLIYAQRQKSNSSSPFDLPASKSVLKNATSSSNIQGKYTANEINEIISNLYDDLRSDNTTEQHLHHNIGILLFVCVDKKNENATPACDISTEIQTDWNKLCLTADFTPPYVIAKWSDSTALFHISSNHKTFSQEFDLLDDCYKEKH